MIYALIMLSAALVVATAALTVQIRRNRAQIRKMRALYEALRGTMEREFSNIDRTNRDIMSCVDDLKNGVVPDYEKAKAAAKAVNDFHDGLAGIMGFDPMQAIKRSRENSGGNAE